MTKDTPIAHLRNAVPGVHLGSFAPFGSFARPSRSLVTLTGLIRMRGLYRRGWSGRVSKSGQVERVRPRVVVARMPLAKLAACVLRHRLSSREETSVSEQSRQFGIRSPLWLRRLLNGEILY